MKEQRDNSSLPILLAIAGIVLISVAVGWFLPGQDGRMQSDSLESQSAEPAESSIAEPDHDFPVTDIAADLRRARLAAEADVLAYPPEQSALHFYGRVMAADPDHAIARAELDAVLGRLSGTVRRHLAARDFRSAYGLAQLVAEVSPDHPLVREVRQSLNNIASGMVAQATRHAQAGEDEEAMAVLATSAALPGRGRNEIAAARNSILRIIEARQAAEEQRIEDLRLAAAQATAEWAESVRGAIETGRLITPPGESARDFLAMQNTPTELYEQLRAELVAAIFAAASESTGLLQVSAAENLLTAADELGGDDAEIAALRVSLEQAYIEAEENRVVSLNDIVGVTMPPPHYPLVARNNSVTGWVELLFTVTSSGETANIEVTDSEPQEVFHNSAIRAVESWTFEPREFRGQRIDQRVAVRFVFDIE